MPRHLAEGRTPLAPGAFELVASDQTSRLTITRDADQAHVECLWLLDAGTDEWFTFTLEIPVADFDTFRSWYAADGEATFATPTHELRVTGPGGFLHDACVEMFILGALPRSLWVREVAGLHDYLTA